MKLFHTVLNMTVLNAKQTKYRQKTELSEISSLFGAGFINKMP
jgi:hypothetical protein